MQTSNKPELTAGNKSKQLYFLSLAMLTSIFFLFACNNQDNTAAGQTNKPDTAATASKQLVFDKLVGVWQSEDGKDFEQWTKNDDNTYKSVVFTVKGKDTIIKEQARIYPNNDKWVFENLVSGQNEGKPVKFTAGSITENNVQFSNPAHDFPNDIYYSVPDNNTVKAFIAGKNKKGGVDTVPFNYSRVK